MKVRELLLAHFVPSILKLSTFPGSIKKPLVHEIIRDTKAPSILEKNGRPKFVLIKELFLKGGAGKVKVLSHSEVYVSNISALESVHGSLTASTIHNQQPVRL